MATLAVWFCWAVLTLHASGQKPLSATVAVPELRTDEDAIYAKALEQLFKNEPPRSERIVLPTKTTNYPVSDVAFLGIKGDKAFRKHWLDTLQAFVRASRGESTVDQAAIQALVRRALQNTSIQFVDPYRGAGNVLSVSSIGFSADRTRALVSVDYSCGGLCGYGTYVFLRKKHGHWTVVYPKGGTWPQMWS
jgi:hypothetical protein